MGTTLRDTTADYVRSSFSKAASSTLKRQHATTFNTQKTDHIISLVSSREFLQEHITPTATATINRRLAALRRFFAWAKENHLTESQSAKRIRNVEITTNGPKSLDCKQWYRLQRSVE